MNKTIAAQALTAEDFAPFGDVIEAAGDAVAINQGQTRRFDDLAELQLTGKGGKAALSIFRTRPLALPLLLRQMECHHLGSQAFVPLSAKPWLVIVAPRGKFDQSKMRAFLASGKQGVNFRPGTWHHFSLALGEICEFLVIDRKSDESDCEQVELSPPIEVTGLP